MPPKKNNNNPKANNNAPKNLFEIGFEDEPAIEAQPKNRGARGNQGSAQLNTNINIKNALNMAFGDEPEDEVVEEQVADLPQNQPQAEKRPLSRADFPHIFAGMDDNDVQNINMPEIKQKEAPVNPENNQRAEIKTEVNNVQANNNQPNNAQSAEEAQRIAKLNSQIDALGNMPNPFSSSNKSVEKNKELTYAERLASLRSNVMDGRDEDDDIIEDEDEDELSPEEEREYQRILQNTKANMPKSKAPNPNATIPQHPPVNHNAQPNNAKTAEEAQRLATLNNNIKALDKFTNPFLKSNKPIEKPKGLTYAERLAALRGNIMNAREDEDDVLEDEDELNPEQEREYQRILQNTKANMPKPKSSSSNEKIFPEVKFEIPKTANGRIDPSFFEEDDEELDTNIKATNKEWAEKKEKDAEPANERNGIFFNEQLKAYNKMYGTKIEANDFAAKVSDSWELIKSTDPQKKAEGKKLLSDTFKATLKEAFEIEKKAAYEEQRLPDYTEITKGTNELFRATMFSFTDLYIGNKKNLFKETSFGGLTEKDIGLLTEGNSIWSMDQRSNQAWKIQSAPAKNIANEWLKEEKPYEKMISEMKALITDNKDKITDRKAVYDKLAAAEWLLLNNDKMMIDDPTDPLNKMPNWGTRYWQAITNARDALGVPRHISMRELIQGNYAEMSKVAGNAKYNEVQAKEQIFEPKQLEAHDSLDKQKVEFTIKRNGIIDTTNEKKIQESEMTSTRMKISVPECDERLKMKEEAKVNNFVPQKAAEIEVTADIIKHN